MTNAEPDAAWTAEAWVPRLRPGVYLREREGERWLLFPEGYMELDEIGWDVLCLVDGRRSVEQIVGLLSASYDAPRDQIRADVLEFLEELRRSGVLV